jgi:acetolactate synthase-1/2/3 large subunit
MPNDVQLGTVEYNPDIEFNFELKKRPSVDISTALELLKNSKKPFIYAGGGVVISNASEELLKFADLIDAPIGTSLMGISAIPYDNPKCLGMAGMHGRYAASKALAECDLLIAVGARFSDRATGNKKLFVKHCKMLQIDIDRAEIDKNIQSNASVNGDVKEVLSLINTALPRQNNQDWLSYVMTMKGSANNVLEVSKNAVNPKSVIETVSNHMSSDTVVATDVGQHQMWAAQYYKFRKPRTFITSGGLGTMGFGMGAAVGSCIGNGKKRTVLFTSDGSFHMNMNELVSAVSHKLPITVIMMDNNALGMVRQWQTMFFGKRYAETTLNRVTDYVKVAEAFGAQGYRINSIEELSAALIKSSESAGPSLIYCKIDSDENVFPMIPPGGTIHDIIIR